MGKSWLIMIYYGKLTFLNLTQKMEQRDKWQQWDFVIYLFFCLFLLVNTERIVNVRFEGGWLNTLRVSFKTLVTLLSSTISQSITIFSTVVSVSLLVIDVSWTCLSSNGVCVYVDCVLEERLFCLLKCVKIFI